MTTPQPAPDFLVCSPVSARAERTQSGLFLAPKDGEDKSDNIFAGRVLLVGENVKRYSFGDVVFFGKFTARKCEVNGVPFIAIREDEVCMALKGQKQPESK